jgi:hypothetical protein
MAAGTSWAISGAVIAVLGGVGAYSMMSGDCDSCLISSMFGRDAKVVAASEPADTQPSGCCSATGQDMRAQAILASAEAVEADHCEGQTGTCPFSGETTLAADATEGSPCHAEAEGHAGVLLAADATEADCAMPCEDKPDCGDCDEPCDDCLEAKQTADSGAEAGDGAG